jgi:hypothetical protein
MADQFTHELKLLLTAFQEILAERDALRMKNKIEASANIANWEKLLQASQTRAQEIFQPALSDLEDDAPLTLVLEKLLERLQGPHK